MRWEQVAVGIDTGTLIAVGDAARERRLEELFGGLRLGDVVTGTVSGPASGSM
jgi:hypothetical protein